MSIKEILNTGASIQLVINPVDLKEAFLQWSEEQRQNQKVQEQSYLTVQEAARKLGVDISTLWRWNKTGYLKKIKVGNKPYYKLSDIQKLMEG